MFVCSVVTLAVLLALSESAPCSSFPTAGCSSCIQWRKIEPGHTFCSYVKNSNGQMTKICDRVKVANKVCVEERLGWQRCTKWHKMKGSLSKVMEEFELNPRQFRELNKGFSMDSNLKNVEVCVKGEYFEYCNEMYQTDGVEKCASVLEAFEISEGNFENLNPGIRCVLNSALPKTSVCVEDRFCAYRHTVKQEDTCEKLQRAYKMQPHVFHQLNPKVDCKTLVLGSRVCVWTKKERPVPDMTCTAEVVIKRGDTCYTLGINNGRPIDELRFLNPHLDCSNLPFGTKICVKGASTKVCAAIVNVDPTTTCRNLVSTHAADDIHLFFDNNPLLQCDKINETQQICAGSGYFKATDCAGHLHLRETSNFTELLRDPPFNVTDEVFPTVAEKLQVARKRFFQYNGDLKDPPLKPIEKGTLICTKPRDRGTDNNVRTIASALAIRSSGLTKVLERFENNPSFTTENDLSYVFGEEIKNDYVYSLLKQIHRGNKTIREALRVPDEDKRRKEQCDEMKRKGTYDEDLQKCFCGTEELYIYCTARLTTELFTKNSSTKSYTEEDLRSYTTRQKRFVITCQPNFGVLTKLFGVGADKKKVYNSHNDGPNAERELKPEDQKPTVSDQEKLVSALSLGAMPMCAGAQCTLVVLPVPLEYTVGFEVCFDTLDAMKPALDALVVMVTGTYDERVEIQQVAVSTFSSLHVALFFKICVAMSQIAEKLAAFASLCWEVVRLKWFPFKGIIVISSTLTIGPFSAGVTFTFKIHDILPIWDNKKDEIFDRSICGLPRHRCEDFCILRREDKTTSGSLSFGVNLWIWAKTFTFPILAPQSEGCRQTDVPIITIVNRRTCDSTVTVICRSHQFAVVHLNSTLHELGRKRMIIGSTFSITITGIETKYHVHCELISAIRGATETIAVYGGTAPSGSMNHYYVLEDNKNVYYAIGKDVANLKLSKKPVGALKPPYCDDEEFGSPELSEPAYNSTDLRCAECGMRSVYFLSKNSYNSDPIVNSSTMRVIPNTINSYTHIIYNDIVLNWDTNNRSIVAPTDVTLSREVHRKAAMGTFMLCSVSVNQEIFRTSNETLFYRDVRNYAKTLALTVKDLKIDGIDLSRTSTAKLGNATDQRLIKFMNELQEEFYALRKETGRKNTSYLITMSQDAFDNEFTHLDNEITELREFTKYISFFTLGPGKGLRNLFIDEYEIDNKTFIQRVGMKTVKSRHLSHARTYIKDSRKYGCRIGRGKMNMHHVPNVLHILAECTTTQSKCWDRYYSYFFFKNKTERTYGSKVAETAKCLNGDVALSDLGACKVRAYRKYDEEDVPLKPAEKIVLGFNRILMNHFGGIAYDFRLNTFKAGDLGGRFFAVVKGWAPCDDRSTSRGDNSCGDDGMTDALTDESLD